MNKSRQADRELYLYAIANNWSAQEELGDMFRTGKGAPRNLHVAFYWYKRAARNNYGPAQTKLGEMYQRQGNYTQALNWYHKGITEGEARAKENADRLYQTGYGVRKLGKQGLEIYNKATKGDSRWAYELARLFDEEQLYRPAMYWYQKAAKDSHLISITRIGVFYEKGLGVEKDWTAAGDYYHKAAAWNYAPAQMLYVKLMLQEERYDVSRPWLDTLIRGGNAEALQILKRLDDQKK